MEPIKSQVRFCYELALLNIEVGSAGGVDHEHGGRDIAAEEGP